MSESLAYLNSNFNYSIAQINKQITNMIDRYEYAVQSGNKQDIENAILMLRYYEKIRNKYY